MHKRKPTPTPKLAWSIETFAAASELGRDGVYKAIADGRLEAKKFGNRTLITDYAARRFLAQLPGLVLGDAAA
jgi:hypothetical protein